MSFSNLNSADFQNFVYLLLLLFVSIFGMVFRDKASIPKILKYFGIWSAVGLIVIIFYSYRYEFSDLKNRVMGEINPSSVRVMESGQIIINISQDGHFYMNVLVNDIPVRFMIDTGASDISMNKNDAQRVGISLKKLNFNKPYQTANGKSWGAGVKLDEVTVGNLRFNDVWASVNNSEMGTSLLGMSFLRRFKKYEFYQDELILYI